ncbi:TetR/AcrR family transcriptional regulator [Undibacterium sp.]|jgi:AcrR family transcriptional regulator|uniref:TetR/AcrR family transcriptional regulator n=1 Tax=Undibacterium sp. TaxID=1914977 RepID=UPI002CB69C6B|nr:TetR/AcrR family transcriptional regulator [Undibacterium sp.]HTD03092.1 TetR/AcrR family transcriptional regulator [Undibacterium sp.]
MVRLAKFTEDSIINASIEVAARCGVAAVSMSAIAGKAGAPIGSVYHRFESRGAILARAWLQVKADFRHAVARHWSDGNTWAAVAAFLQWCREKPLYAKFLLQCEDCPVFNEPLSAELNAELEAEQDALDQCFRQCLAHTQSGSADSGEAEAILRFMLFASPIAMVKPYLLQDLDIPARIEQVLRASHDAVTAAHSGNPLL